jgi:hypothetical protein
MRSILRISITQLSKIRATPKESLPLIPDKLTIKDLYIISQNNLKNRTANLGPLSINQKLNQYKK